MPIIRVPPRNKANSFGMKEKKQSTSKPYRITTYACFATFIVIVILSYPQLPDSALQRCLLFTLRIHIKCLNDLIGSIKVTRHVIDEFITKQKSIDGLVYKKRIGYTPPSHVKSIKY